MLKRYSFALLTLALSVAFASANLRAQENSEPQKPNPDLSLDSLMIDAPKLPEKINIDPELLKFDKNASFDELNEFVETLQTKLPTPKSQDDYVQILDAVSKTFLEVADVLLARDNLDAEQRDRAVQLKVVALTTRAHLDPASSQQLVDFVEENLKAAKTTDELVKAYQLKLQVLASTDDSLDKIDALAKEMFALEQEEMQLFAIEVKAQSFIKKFQRDNVFDDSLILFVDEIIADENRSKKVKEKAYEMKFVAAVVAAEVEREKAADQQDAKVFQNVEDLFALLSTGDFSDSLKKTVYQLRVQTLMDPNASGDDLDQKIDAVIAQLLKEEDAELYALGVAVKGQKLLNGAKNDPNAVKAVAEYADEVYALAKEKPELKTQAIGLKIQAFGLQKKTEELYEFVNQELAAEPDDVLKDQLTKVKLSVVAELVNNNPDAYPNYKDFILEVNKDPKYQEGVSQIYSAKFVATLGRLQEQKADLKAFDAALKDFEADLLISPHAVAAIIFTQPTINEIGKINNDDALFEKALQQIGDFCKTADSDELNAIAQQIDRVQMQMKAEAEKKANEEKDDAEKE